MIAKSRPEEGQYIMINILHYPIKKSKGTSLHETVFIQVMIACSNTGRGVVGGGWWGGGGEGSGSLHYDMIF